MTVALALKSRLWVERLLIVESIDPVALVRDIPMRPGLNVVWAKEPVATTGLSLRERAGHGVGKSTFCLMLRFILGDDGKAVRAMRHLLAKEMPNGGVGAVVHVGEEVYSVFRPYGADGMSVLGSDLESLLAGGDHLPLRDYVAVLSTTMLKNLQQTEIPGTGQSIEWNHVLSWATRDQGTRLRTYYDWRSDGAGMQRAKQDPPWVLRSVLGVTDAQEANAVRALAQLGKKITQAEAEIRVLEQAPSQIRSRIEASLRGWAGSGSDIQFRSEDLFRSSVIDAIEQKKTTIQADFESIDGELSQAESSIRHLENAVEEADNQFRLVATEFEIAEAQRDRDEEKIKALNERLAELRSLGGDCAHGGIPFQQCTHIQARLTTTSFVDGRDKKAIERESAEWAKKAVTLLPRNESAEKRLNAERAGLQAAFDKKRQLKIRRDTKLSDLALPNLLLRELESWEEASGALGVAELNERRAALLTLSKQRDSADAQILSARTAQQARKSEMSKRFDGLAKLFELNGRFQSDNEERPFELVGSSGEAYSVLEILLGDFACVLDCVGNAASSFPGFLVQDCPREADLSDRLYGAYLSMLANKEEEPFTGWQVVVTTTTAPPLELQSSPHLVLELGPSRDDDLLLRRRFGLQ